MGKVEDVSRVVVTTEASRSDDYVPGALSLLLRGHEGNATVIKKKRKRMEQKSANAAAALFEKRVTNPKPVELPIGEQKLQPKSVLPNETDNLSEMKKLKKLKVAEEEARTIYVGNAPRTSTRKDIKKLFSKFGVVESVRLRSVIAADEKMSKKVAVLKQDLSEKMKSFTFYVKFRDAKSVESALTLNGEKMGENMLRVDRCCGPKKYSSKTTVFVGNLPFDVTENELTAHFEQCGTVSFVRIVRDSRTGNGKGFAFVGFKEAADVPLALQLNESAFRMRQLRVTKVKKNKIKCKTPENLSNYKRRPNGDAVQRNRGRDSKGWKKKFRGSRGWRKTRRGNQ